MLRMRDQIYAYSTLVQSPFSNEEVIIVYGSQ